ncbi:MAG: type II toxin-antitoxin system PemK/MazF family toxin [Nocardioidaceae bacterium]
MSGSHGVAPRRLLSSMRRIIGRRSRTAAVPRAAARDTSARAELVLDYSPQADGQPDPGEVVWTWVPYEDDPNRGKDRPVLIIGRLGTDLAGLMLTSKDHDRDAADEARWGRHWMDVGSGSWDREGRRSEVRLDRLLTLAPAAVRREGAALPRSTFEQVVNAARSHLA